MRPFQELPVSYSYGAAVTPVLDWLFPTSVPTSVTSFVHLMLANVQVSFPPSPPTLSTYPPSSPTLTLINTLWPMCRSPPCVYVLRCLPPHYPSPPPSTLFTHPNPYHLTLANVQVAPLCLCIEIFTPSLPIPPPIYPLHPP